MSDRDKWNARYAAGAYGERLHPSAYLAAQIHRFPAGAAADVACGRGRNAIFLAQHGFNLTGFDIADVGLAGAQVRAHALGLNIQWQQRDLLADGLPPTMRFDLIVMVRFVATALIEELHQHLNPGGFALIEEHLQHSDADVVGPTSDRFRLAPGALVHHCRALAIVDEFEGLVTEPDGQRAAVARVVAQRSEKAS